MNALPKRLSYFTVLIICMVIMGQVQAESVEGSTYSIISDNEFRDVKRSIDVKLDRKVSAETLRMIARKLKNMEHKKYDRTFITYYLPNMKVGAGAWATTHFDPELEMKILGLTAEEEEKMTRVAKNTLRDVVGVWMDDRPYVAAFYR